MAADADIEHLFFKNPTDFPKCIDGPMLLFPIIREGSDEKVSVTKADEEDENNNVDKLITTADKSSVRVVARFHIFFLILVLLMVVTDGDVASLVFGVS